MLCLSCYRFSVELESYFRTHWNLRQLFYLVIGHFVCQNGRESNYEG